MDISEFKLIVIEFAKGLHHLIGELQLVEDGDITGAEDDALIEHGRAKLVRYDEIIQMVADKPTWLESFKNEFDDQMDSLREALTNIAAQ